MARKQVIDTSRFKPLGGTSRRYIDLRTGENISRYQAIKRQTGKSPAALAAERAAREPTPALDRLKDRLSDMLARGFRPDDIALRTRVFAEKGPGKATKALHIEGRPSRELVSAGTIRDVVSGRTAVSEKRAGAILRALDNPEVSFRASAIDRNGDIVTFELVGEDSVHKFHNYYDAVMKLSEGDSRKFDRLRPRDFEIRIIGPSGRVETYRLNDDKDMLRRELAKGRFEDFELPDRETKRGKS